MPQTNISKIDKIQISSAKNQPIDSDKQQKIEELKNSLVEGVKEMENELDSKSMQEGGHASIIEKLQSAATVIDEIDDEPTR